MTGIRAMHDHAGADIVGGKAAALMKLAGLGFDVPPFLVVEPSAFNGTGLLPGAQALLAERLQALAAGPFAVRSSARAEDGARDSHAGQFLSVLGLEPKDVAEAAIRVFKSGRRDSVAAYRESRGIDAQGDALAVIVQQMVDARCAGVAFTADPVSGRRDRIMVSAIAGLGDRLVGGEEDGQTFAIDKATGDHETDVADPVLSEADLAALRDLALKLEAELGAPQDIEWAFAGERLYLLQARPITTALRAEPIADDHLLVFDNSNIIESYPSLVSPLTYSFAQYAYARVYRAFVRIVGVPEATIAKNAAVFDNMLARVDGRVYYNLGNWYRALALLPGFSINRSFMETMMGVSQPLPPELGEGIGPAPAKGFSLVREWLRVGRVGLRLAWEGTRLGRTIDDFYRRLNNALAEPAHTLDVMPLTKLAEEYRRIEADLLDRWDAPLINDFLCMVAFGASRKRLEKWAGPAGLELHNDVMIGQGDIVSAEPAQRIRAMGEMLRGSDELRRRLAQGDGSGLASRPELDRAVRSYLDKFADRCAEELKLESIPLDRDPAPLYRAIAAASLSTTPAVQHQAHTTRDLRSVMPGRPVRRLVAGALLAWAKRRVRDRENLRFERTRIFGRARHLFRAAAVQLHAHGMIDDPDDIFLLTVQEVLGAIEGFAVSQDLKEIARLRKTEMEQSRTRPDPGERLMVRGAAIVGLGKPAPVATREQDPAEERTGTGCSKGVVTAVARVIRDPRTHSLNKGEILVARHTDPGWIALFSNASAIVVERGSLLSHSAIVARELGIPCVVGLKGALDWIADGEIVEVDGGSGRVLKVG
jgi:phosphohistidine swiveling domain-containing protein